MYHVWPYAVGSSSIFVGVFSQIRKVSNFKRRSKIFLKKEEREIIIFEVALERKPYGQIERLRHPISTKKGEREGERFTIFKVYLQRVCFTII